MVANSCISLWWINNSGTPSAKAEPAGYQPPPSSTTANRNSPSTHGSIRMPPPLTDWPNMKSNKTSSANIKQRCIPSTMRDIASQNLSSILPLRKLKNQKTISGKKNYRSNLWRRNLNSVGCREKLVCRMVVPSTTHWGWVRLGQPLPGWLRVALWERRYKNINKSAGSIALPRKSNSQ